MSVDAIAAARERSSQPNTSKRLFETQWVIKQDTDRMTQLECPVEGCAWKSQNLADAHAAALNTALQGHITTAHTQPLQAAAKPEKLSRPTISKGCSSEDWGYFTTVWSSYKKATKLSPSDTNVQLLACCDGDLRRDLHRTDKALEQKAEADILKTIKSLAVKQENSMVSRLALHNMSQDRDEGVRNFAARLKGQADVCKFTVKCPCNPSVEVDFTSQMIRDVLIRGLSDQDIQQEMLGQQNQDMELEETVKLIEAKEAGRRSQTSIMTESAHFASQYRKNGQSDRNLPSKTTCEKCEKPFTRPLGRGGKPRPYKMCKTCFTSQRSKPGEHKKHILSEQEGDEGNQIYDTICATTTRATNPIKLSHHVFNDMEGWRQRRSLPQPEITITARVCKDDYAHFRAVLKSSPSGGPISAIADTGCQSCLIGLNVVYKLGFRKADLLAVEHKMNAVNKNAINIVGAVLLRFCGSDKDGYPIETAQLCYVTPDTNKTFLSREACVDLGLISVGFPSLGETNKKNDIYSSVSVTEDVNDSQPQMDTCDCPRRALPPPVPRNMPFPPTEQNVEKIKQWLLDYYASSTFNVCPHSQLPLMTGPPVKLMVDPEAKPVAVHTPIPVPMHWQAKVKAGLDRDVSLGVIEPVPIGEPVTWCHRMVVCRKKNGEPRRTVDLQTLNAHCTRETHHTQSPFHQARAIPSNKKKSVFDAWNGYHSVPIRECDRHLTTFITPWGRYRYCSTPQGYIASGDGYTRRFDEIITSFANKTKCVDDTCMWSDTVEGCFHQACEWLDLCGRNGIVLNPDKFVFAQDSVEFAGFEITLDKVKPCNKYIDAIAQFPTPQNITDIRSWFGLINQVSYYASMADRMRPFRDLLKPKTTFYWDDQLQQIFDESKQFIVDAIKEGVQIFDKQRKTCLATDWSKEGIGFLLLQKHCVCPGDAPFCCPDGWKVTLVGSRFTHPAESRYAPVEGEALAVADALDRTRYFTLGCDDLIVAVDHKPLLKVLGDRKLEDIKNPRLFNLKEKTLPFKFRIIHVPGKRHLASDAVSRHPTGDPEQLRLPDDVHAACESYSSIWCTQNDMLKGIRVEPEEACMSTELEYSVAAASTLDSMQSVTWDRVREETTSDPNLFELLETIEDGMPDSKMLLPPTLREYFPFREQLSTTDGVVMYRDRVVVPPSLRDEVLSALHAAHQGVTSMTARANMSVFWPGISIHIARMRERCEDCNRMAPSHPSAPPTTPVDPAFPFQCICADYFTYKGVHYLIVVDRYSNWPIMKRARDGAAGLVQSLREEFVTYGIPEELSSDGGPEFTAAATQVFLKSWGVKHRVSSVAFPHSNCRAEVGVKTCKRLIASNTGPNGELDIDEFQRAVLQYRNSPDQDTKMSPAMIIFGHCVRDFIPVPPGRYMPQSAWIDNADLRESALRKRHFRADERLNEHTRILPPLRVGDHVRIQNQVGNDPRKWDKTGVVVEVKQHDQYVIRTDGSGRATLRNRRFLRKFHLYEPAQHSPIPQFQCQSTPPVFKPSVVSSPHSDFPHQARPIPESSKQMIELTQKPILQPVEPVLPSVEASVPFSEVDITPPHTDIAEPSDVIQRQTASPPSPSSSIRGNSDTRVVNVTAPTNCRPKRTCKPPARYDPADWDLKR